MNLSFKFNEPSWRRVAPQYDQQHRNSYFLFTCLDVSIKYRRIYEIISYSHTNRSIWNGHEIANEFDDEKKTEHKLKPPTITTSDDYIMSGRKRNE